MNEETTFSSDEKAEIDKIIDQVITLDKDQQRILIDKLTKGSPKLKSHILESLELMYDPPLIGKMIANYRIISRLENAGGSATAYKAKHTVLDTLAVIKIFDKFPEITDDWESEYKSLSSLEHDNIVKFYNTGIYESERATFCYVIIEYINGQHFDKYCEDKNPSLINVLTLFKDLCSVIEYIHKEKIPHLDLKPANILITNNNPRVKLIDFGSSKLLIEKKRETDYDTYNPLTLKFASPEQIRVDQEIRHSQHSTDKSISQEDIDKRSDIFSLGIILYYLLTGYFPYGEFKTKEEKEHLTSENRLELEKEEKKKLKDELLNYNSSYLVLPSQRVLKHKDKIKFEVSSSTLSSILKGDLDRIIQKCLEKRKEDRYQDVSTLKVDIINFLEGRPVSVRKSEFGYTISKKFLHWLGVKGGLVGDERWLRPLKNILYTLILLICLAITAYAVYWQFFRKHYVIIPKSIEKPTTTTTYRLKVKELINSKVFVNKEVKKDNLYIYCQEPGQLRKSCFNFLEIPPSENFQMGRRDSDLFVDDKYFISKDIKNVSELQTEQQKIEAGNSRTSKETTIPVNINKFYMSKFEISIQQWNIVAKGKPNDTNTILKVVVEDDNTRSLPKTNISYYEAVEFCSRLSRDLSDFYNTSIIVRLPSESEWERACRANNYSRFGAGDEVLVDFANVNYTPSSASLSEEIMISKLSKTPLTDSEFVGNSLGLSAMSGNVWEMVSDDWRENLDAVPQDGTPWRDNSKDSRKKFVLKGGSFNSHAYMAQCSYRTNGYADSPGNNQVGFRIVLESSEDLEEIVTSSPVSSK